MCHRLLHKNDQTPTCRTESNLCGHYSYIKELLTKTITLYIPLSKLRPRCKWNFTPFFLLKNIYSFV